MNISKATRSFEAWMRSCTKVVESDLKLKHEQMREDLFLFLRGTYYRWAQVWPKICKDLVRAPKVIGSGDLHVGSFGTWRDSEGRMCWGVDDFDESYPLPYTNDLVRLAASLKLVTDSGVLTIRFKDGCDAILDGYQNSVRTGGCPIVLAEHERNLESLGIEAIRPPQDFWKKLNALPVVNANQVPPQARRALVKMLPAKVSFKIVRRRAGLGSLGQLRFAAIADWEGGCVAREAKAMTPSASLWVGGKSGHGESYYERVIASAVRSPDPYQKIIGGWLIRRLSPDSNPIEIDELPKKRDEGALLYAMGREVGNVHLGTRNQVKNILKDLRTRKKNWLRFAAREMANATEKDWKKYRSDVSR
jgi:hypothetical protein